MSEAAREKQRPAAPVGSGAFPAQGRGLLAKTRTTLEMIKFEHSVFALPFALTGALLAVRGWPTLRQLFWLIVAMVGARSAAMTFNRVADLEFDMPGSPVSAGLRAWAPFLPGDSRSSNTPAAVFELRLRNVTGSAQEGRVAFFGSWLDFENSHNPFLQNFLKQDELIPALDITL